MYIFKMHAVVVYNAWDYYIILNFTEWLRFHIKYFYHLINISQNFEVTVGSVSTLCANYLQYIRSTTKVLVILERLRKREENTCLGAEELASSVGSTSYDLKLGSFTYSSAKCGVLHLSLDSG